VTSAQRHAIDHDADIEVAALAGELRVAITRTARRLRTEGMGEAVTASQYTVLVALKSQPSTLHDLARSEGVQPPSMSRTVASLVERGLVTRTEDPQDRRQALVTITEAGRDVLAKSRERRTAWLSVRLTDLNAQQRQVLAEAAAILASLK
jgi:DNA-binding MarR family transcriptional regulator